MAARGTSRRDYREWIRALTDKGRVGIHSTVPLSSGLSSSAALECATATVFQELGGWNLPPVDKALLCQRAENRFVGVNCGILDQFTSCMGEKGCALLLDCSDLSSNPVAIADGIRIVICDTKSKRELAGSEYGERRTQCEEGARLLEPALRWSVEGRGSHGVWWFLGRSIVKNTDHWLSTFYNLTSSGGLRESKRAMNDLTLMLQNSDGDEKLLAEKVLPLVYEELRRFLSLLRSLPGYG